MPYRSSAAHWAYSAHPAHWANKPDKPNRPNKPDMKGGLLHDERPQNARQKAVFCIAKHGLL